MTWGECLLFTNLSFLNVKSRYVAAPFSLFLIPDGVSLPSDRSLLSFAVSRNSGPSKDKELITALRSSMMFSSAFSSMKTGPNAMSSTRSAVALLVAKTHTIVCLVAES